MIKHEVVIEDEENSNGDDVCRWRCTGCGSKGHWTPERERALVAIRGDAHLLRARNKRPTKAQLAARKGKGREAGPEEYSSLRGALRIPGF